MNIYQVRTQVKKHIDQLSPESLQIVTEFVAYLIDKENLATNSNINALELAGELVGCIEGLPDLSTNKNYFKKFGKS